MKKKLICVFVFGLLLTLSSFAFAQVFDNFKPGNEPDGFSGIKWGTDISTLPDMEYVSTDPSYGEIQIYKKKNDELKMGGLLLRKLIMVFGEGKRCLYSIM